ncbi:MAG: thioredoxin family protein [Gammaproteobacteria bacterium]|jgi:thioredoxin 1|nr:thioredoxin family protein [Gammaproteobacteria bacterium]
MSVVAAVLFAIAAAWLAYLAFVVRSSRAMVGRRVRDLGDALRGLDAPGGRGLVYFYSEGCPPCREMTPMIDRLAKDHPLVLKVDVGADPETARRFGVRATPTTFIVRDGLVTRSILGARRREVFEKLLSSP